jgi:hypothetical protein
MIEVAIAILLALILVAMVSSNKSAANGVWKVVRWALLGGLLLAAWLILVLYAVWFYNAYPKPDWEMYLGIAAHTLLPPFLLFVNWKTVVKSFQADKRAAIKFTAKLVAYVVGLLVVAILYQEGKQVIPNFGWSILISVIAFTGAVLTWRSATWPNGQHVWTNPPSLPEPWTVVHDEKVIAANAIEAEWDALQDRNDLSQSEYEAIQASIRAKAEANETRLAALLKKLEAEYAAWEKKRNALSFRTVFWFAVIFSGCGLIGIAFDYAFDYAMTFEFIKGRAWMATGAVILGGMALGGIVISIYEDMTKKKAPPNN